ncbi:MAG: hypothetical protein ACHQRM_12420 [Bacteroidia bacterium]
MIIKAGFNRSYLFLLFLVLLPFIASAQQDTLFFVNGTTQLAKVSEVTTFDVSYTVQDSVKGTVRKTVDSDEIRLIVYSNGIIQIITIRHLAPVKDMLEMRHGLLDAGAHYDDGGGMIAVGLTSFLTGGIIGIIPAVACSSVRPRFSNLGIPPGAPLRSKDYMLGYVSQATHMKKKRIWGAYFTGLAGAVVAVLIVNHH